MPEDMPLYIGTKTIKARPMDRLHYNHLRGWALPAGENPDDEGFLVEYTDGGEGNHPDFEGYISWSPKVVFERAYKRMPGDGHPPHEQRVMLEKAELDERLGKLESFTDTAIFDGLPEMDKHLLLLQLDQMMNLSDILGKRIARFGSVA